MNKIVLDQESFKALAASTRIEVLKLLHRRPHTQAELAQELEMKPASVNEHLKALLKADLINQKDEGRKWKYYSLTEKGRCVLEPERKQIWITLAVLIFSFIGTVLSYLKGLFGRTDSSQMMQDQLGQDVYQKSVMLPQQAEYASQASTEMLKESTEAFNYASEAGRSVVQNAEVIQQEPNYLLYFFVILMITSLAMLIFFWYRKKRW